MESYISKLEKLVIDINKLLVDNKHNEALESSKLAIELVNQNKKEETNLNKKIIQVFNKVKPETIPNVNIKLWKTGSTRDKTLTARVKDFKSLYSLSSDRDVLLCFASFFQFISKSDFLCNKAQKSAGYETYTTDFDKLIDPKKFAFILEGRYTNGEKFEY